MSRARVNITFTAEQLHELDLAIGQSDCDGSFKRLMWRKIDRARDSAPTLRNFWRKK